MSNQIASACLSSRSFVRVPATPNAARGAPGRHHADWHEHSGRTGHLLCATEPGASDWRGVSARILLSARQAVADCNSLAQRLVARAEPDGFVPRWRGLRLLAAGACIELSLLGRGNPFRWLVALKTNLDLLSSIAGHAGPLRAVRIINRLLREQGAGTDHPFTPDQLRYGPSW